MKNLENIDLSNTDNQILQWKHSVVQLRENIFKGIWFHPSPVVIKNIKFYVISNDDYFECEEKFLLQKDFHLNLLLAERKLQIKSNKILL